MNNLIIVESEADKYFIEAFIENLNLANNIEVGLPICSINDFDCLGGFNNLESRLYDIKFYKYDNVGIILDADNEGIQKRVDLINETFKYVCDDLNIKEQCKLYSTAKLEVKVAAYITNVDGYGELENILKAVKSEDSVFADCLESWKQCLKEKGEQISDKEFNKFWVNNYLRLDTCKKAKHRGNKGRYCSQSEETMKKDIWDFDSPYLSDLKKFLELFN